VGHCLQVGRSWGPGLGSNCSRRRESTRGRGEQLTPKGSAIVGGVVAAVESLGAEAGAEMLKAGGNAADAAVAAAFAQGVADPIYCGIAGGFHGLFWNQADKRAWVVSGGGHAPRAARPDMWQPKGRSGAVWSVQGA